MLVDRGEWRRQSNNVGRTRKVVQQYHFESVCSAHSRVRVEEREKGFSREERERKISCLYFMAAFHFLSTLILLSPLVTLRETKLDGNKVIKGWREGERKKSEKGEKRKREMRM